MGESEHVMEFSHLSTGYSPAQTTKSGRRPRYLLSAGLPAFFLGAVLALVIPAAGASAAGATFYAYVGGGALLPASCPATTVKSKQCTLSEALARAAQGGAVMLATPGQAAHYVGNWDVGPFSSTLSPVITIEAAPGTTRPTLDGNHGRGKGCTTTTCNGPLLTVRPRVHLSITGLALVDANNTVDDFGGAIVNHGAAIVTVSNCTFSGNRARNGGAIDNGDNGGNGTVTVSSSIFIDNAAVGNKRGRGDGGAIDNADNGGAGTLTVSTSTFSGNSAGGDKSGTGGGGAIDNGGSSGSGTFKVTTSTFTANTANYGGAIANGTGAGAISLSSFSGNTAGYGGAVANGVSGRGTMTVSGSTFSANKASGNGGAIDNGDGLDLQGTLAITTSTFSGNSATGATPGPSYEVLAHKGDGGAIDNGDNEGSATLTVATSTFSANLAKVDGPTISNFVTLWSVANVFNGTCHEASGGLWTDEGYNVGSDATCLSGGSGDVDHGANLLGPLAGNGGTTKTMVPLASNPAVGAIPYNTTVVLNGRPLTVCPSADQRGVVSRSGARCNAGAVQSS